MYMIPYKYVTCLSCIFTIPSVSVPTVDMANPSGIFGGFFTSSLYTIIIINLCYKYTENMYINTINHEYYYLQWIFYLIF